MSDVHLTGQLVCKNEIEARIVTDHLPEHIERTLAEPGCVSFTVTPSDDPLIWTVGEHFEDRRVFELHQKRVAGSEWGRVTADIERRYSIDGLSQ
jgi:quinol monooxygenase YgiN